MLIIAWRCHFIDILQNNLFNFKLSMNMLTSCKFCYVYFEFFPAASQEFDFVFNLAWGHFR